MAHAVDGQTAAYRESGNVLKARRTLMKTKMQRIGGSPGEACGMRFLLSQAVSPMV
jgi:hypothetical protein